MTAEIIHGDCLDVLPALPRADMVLTDPPYGINANRMTLGAGKKDFHRGGEWDRERPDVAWLLAAADRVCIWGGNYFTDQLPPTNHWLIWHKKNDGRSFSECEMAWTNLGVNVRHISHHWGREEKQHPTMKPLRVIQWCVEQAKLPAGSLIIDPYCGSGTTGVAAVQGGYRFIGIERDPYYAEIARKRIADAQAQLTLGAA